MQEQKKSRIDIINAWRKKAQSCSCGQDVQVYYCNEKSCPDHFSQRLYCMECHENDKHNHKLVLIQAVIDEGVIEWQQLFGKYEKLKTAMTGLYEPLAPVIKYFEKEMELLSNMTPGYLGQNELISSQFQEINQICQQSQEFFQNVQQADQTGNLSKLVDHDEMLSNFESRLEDLKELKDLNLNTIYDYYKAVINANNSSPFTGFNDEHFAMYNWLKFRGIYEINGISNVPEQINIFSDKITQIPVQIESRTTSETIDIMTSNLENIQSNLESKINALALQVSEQQKQNDKLEMKIKDISLQQNSHDEKFEKLQQQMKQYGQNLKQRKEECSLSIQGVEEKISELSSMINSKNVEAKQQVEEMQRNLIKRIQEVDSKFSIAIQSQQLNLKEESKKAATLVEQQISQALSQIQIKGFMDSQILTSEQHREFLISSLRGFKPGSQTFLIFRGTQNGWKNQDFHKACDDKGPTVTLIKSEQGRIFGGYTSISWSRSGDWRRDDQMFLFSVTSDAIFRSDKTMTKDVFHGPSYGPRFGNDALFIAHNPMNTGCCSQIKEPQGYEVTKDLNFSKLTGEKNGQYFNIEELEVYQIIL